MCTLIAQCCFKLYSQLGGSLIELWKTLLEVNIYIILQPVKDKTKHLVKRLALSSKIDTQCAKKRRSILFCTAALIPLFLESVEGRPESWPNLSFRDLYINVTNCSGRSCKTIRPELVHFTFTSTLASFPGVTIKLKMTNRFVPAQDSTRSPLQHKSYHSCLGYKHTGAALQGETDKREPSATMKLIFLHCVQLTQK